jgi:methyl-accepting chemotaxis protein
MFGRSSRAETEVQLAAVNKALAVAEFETNGTIITANERFLEVIGYGLEEIKGRRHAMFMPPELRESASYKAFWKKLNDGERQEGEFRRLAKGGREFWIEASYNPVIDGQGRLLKIVEFATEITVKKIRSMADASKTAAIGRAQAVIEFQLDGTIVTANENFCNALGYVLSEIQGRHHSMFMPIDARDSEDYRAFWAKLGHGSIRPANSCALVRVDARSGSRLHTVRCSTTMANLSA